MNPLNWLPFYNEDKQGENFDGSLLVPLTVGLVSVVSSVLVGYRSGLLSRKQADSLIVKQFEHAERSANPTSSREMTKRKTPSKIGNKPSTTTSNPLAFVPSTLEGVVPVLETSSKPQNKQTDDPKLHSAYCEPTQQIHLPQTPKLDAQHIAPEDDITVHSATSKSTCTSVKKTKKTKHSRQSHPEQEPTHGNDIKSAEPEAAWVVVTSKKLKQSSGAVPIDQANQKVSRKKSRISESVSENKNGISTQPEITSLPTDPQAHGDIVLGEADKPTVTYSISEVSTLKTPKPPSASPLGNASAGQTAEKYQQQSTGDHVIATDRPVICHVQDNDRCYANLSQTSVSSAPSKPHVPSNTITNTVAPDPHPSGSQNFRSVSTSLPATFELLTQHLSAQVGAKELECQLLRDEVIRLREEVGVLKQGVPIKHPISVDVETMTAPQEPPVSLASDALSNVAHDAGSSKTASSNIPLPDSPDTVLLLTLQKEIERLAREMKLSQQRNENLEARLATANKQLTTAKSESAKQVKLIQQELGAQTKRLQQSEGAQHRLEEELRESLQQLECTRRKAEQWERERAILVTERDQLTRERETLTSQHQTCLSELENSHRTTEELRATLREVELRAQSLERDRSVVLGESHSRIAQLEAQLSASQEQEQSERAHLQTVESALAQLSTDAEHLRGQLAEKEQELESWKEKAESLQRNVSELSERQKLAETRTSLAAETIQSVSDTEPVAASSLTLLEATTQTDPEPRTEFESESLTATADTVLGTNYRTSELEVSQLNTVAISPLPEPIDDVTDEDLKAEVARYKSALNMTELVLADLQNSVDEEAERWRKALDASRMECEVLEDRLTKTESSLNLITEERDVLLKKLEEIPSRCDSQQDRVSVGHQSIEDDRSSVQSLTVARMLDSVRFDETTPKPELIRLLNKFRYLIQVEHDALKKEQNISSELQSQLAVLQRRISSQSSVSESALNGIHSLPPLPAESKSTSVAGFLSDVSIKSDVPVDQGDQASGDGVITAPPVPDSAAKSVVVAEVDAVPGVLANGLHPSDSVNADSVAP
ncbi:hypothetical protein D915_009352 [Fasciola hepatica]|uniref:Uncharacterized protein n=1 Tax=Fasciola hepatica TaxID=6192 RepID=A0A4E0RFH6_FASHE|nr:hypothetical protein D915_009352 [Fasciola hepatica]